jgi:hypothetical protein
MINEQINHLTDLLEDALEQCSIEYRIHTYIYYEGNKILLREELNRNVSLEMLNFSPREYRKSA